MSRAVSAVVVAEARREGYAESPERDPYAACASYEEARAIDRGTAAADEGDEGPSFDFSDLSGDAAPVSIAAFQAANPDSLEELAELCACPLGGAVRLAIGGGGYVTVRRVS